MLWELKKKAFRAQHRVMKTVATVIPIPIPTVLTGAGSVETLAENIKVRGLKHAFVVTDKVLMELELPKGLLDALEKNGIQYTVFDGVQQNPTIENVENGRQAYVDSGSDCIIGFGGGSPVDCAKIIGSRVRNPYLPVRLMKGLFKVVIPPPPLFCVPTTAGTGTETTMVAVITDPESHEKFAITDLKLVPKIAVLDPELMVGLPPHITAATGMDALTHAVEAYVGLNGNPFTDGNAEEATRLIFENLEKAYNNGSDIEARNNMSLASFYAGVAFTRVYVGYVHAIAHKLGGLYGVPHGLANAIILPHVLRFSREDAEAKLARLAIIGGLSEGGESDEELSYKFIEHVESMNRNMQIPTGVAEIQEEDIPTIAKSALAEAHPDYPVPTIMTQQDCENLIRGLLVRP